MSHAGRKSGRDGVRVIRSAMDRRLACRYSPVTKDVTLFLIGSGSLVDHSVELVNISMQGCLVKARRALRVRPGDKVWLQPLVDMTCPLIDGIVASAVKPFLGKQAIGMRFLAPLPYQTFKMLVYGAEGIDLNLVKRPFYETDQFWK